MRVLYYNMVCTIKIYIKSIPDLRCTRCVHDCETHYPLQVTVRSSHTHNNNNNNNNIETVGVFDVPGTPITNQSTRQTSRKGIHYRSIHIKYIQ